MSSMRSLYAFRDSSSTFTCLSRISRLCASLLAAISFSLTSLMTSIFLSFSNWCSRMRLRRSSIFFLLSSATLMRCSSLSISLCAFSSLVLSSRSRCSACFNASARSFSANLCFLSSCRDFCLSCVFSMRFWKSSCCCRFFSALASRWRSIISSLSASLRDISSWRRRMSAALASSIASVFFFHSSYLRCFSCSAARSSICLLLSAAVSAAICSCSFL
mmetsp:Transcript_35997/g.113910  ORF Transcript_35997/g.113910 Transcript_35997/m.113910 type:complete len:218 (+) Transcript_35997:246-899(+)